MNLGFGNPPVHVYKEKRMKDPLQGISDEKPKRISEGIAEAEKTITSGEAVIASAINKDRNRIGIVVAQNPRLNRGRFVVCRACIIPKCKWK